MSGIDPNKIKDAQKLGEMNSRGLNTKETEKRGVLAEQGESEQDISHQPSAENNTEVPTGEFAEGKSEKSLLEELITSATAEKTEEHKPNEVDTENIEANNIKEQASGSELLTVDKTLCDDVITCVELCQSCLRDDEEEAADLWCNDCSEAVCRSCGKAHRRFAVAHDVISIKDATACRKHLPKSCSKHENKKIILFCVGHDKLICHECLSESHRSCDKILEIEKAADGIKNSAAITDLKERMRNFASILEKTQTENKQTISKVSKEKESAYDHIQELFQCFKNHLLTIQNNLNKNYEKIVKQNEENSEQLKYLRQNLQENIDWMCMLERSSSERNIFHAVKHLDAIQIQSEKQIAKIKKDMTTYPLDVLPAESMRNIDKLFEELMGKSKRYSLPKQTAILTSDCLKSQLKVEKEIPPQMEKLYRPPPYQDLIAGDNSTFGALCFTEDGRIIVEESKDFTLEKRYLLKQTIHCLRIFDLETRQSKQITFSQKYSKFNVRIGSICMYNTTLALLASNSEMTGIMVIDINLQRHCRTIYPQSYERIGNIEHIKWVSSKKGKLLLLAETDKGLWLISIDFNGAILSAFSLSNSVVGVDYDGSKRLFHTDQKVNDIFITSIDKHITSKCYSSLDLREGCSILYTVDDELLLLETRSNTIYKLNLKYRSRSILINQNITKPTHFNICHKLKTVAVTMDGGMRVRIFPF